LIDGRDDFICSAWNKIMNGTLKKILTITMETFLYQVVISTEAVFAGEKCGKNDDRWTDMQEIPDSTRRISLEEEKAQSPSLRTSDIVCPVADCAEKAKNKRCDVSAL
jgi:hypothetical protein